MSEEETTILEKRQSKIEDAISKLTEVSSDINKMLAIHELRLSQQEKISFNLENVVEKRREEADFKLKTVYETMRLEDKQVVSELDKLRQDVHEQMEKLSRKTTEIEKFMWTSVGSLTIITLLVTQGPSLLKLFSH